MTVKEYRELYEGLSQEDDKFRKAISAYVGEDMPERLLTELESAQNRLNYAMLGVHPIYRREVELSGIADYKDQALKLYAASGETVLPFQELDPSYVQFLESQKRVYNVKDLMPLSSVALRSAHELLEKEDVSLPDLSGTDMHLPQRKLSMSVKTLQLAFARSMVLMNHLQEEIEKYGLDTIYETNRDDLIQYCGSRSFNYQFDYSVRELSHVADQSTNMNDFSNQ